MSASVVLDVPRAREPVIEVLRALTARVEVDTASVEKPDFTADHRARAVDDCTVPAVATTAPIRWVEPTDNLWLLAIKNYGLALATFGIYHFWGRVEMNRRILNAVEITGRRLDFTGSGREAFVSFTLGSAIAASIVGVFVYLFVLGGGGDGGLTLQGIREFRWQRLTISLPLLFLFGSIAYRKRHHILRRTWIGNERFGLTGHAWSYAWQHFWTAFLVPLTLGWAAPWRSGTLEARKIAEMEHRGMRFKAVGHVGSLYKTFALVWFGGGLLYVATLVVLAQYIGPELIAAINGFTLAPLKSWDIGLAAGKVLAVALWPLLVVALLWRKAWLEYQLSTIGFDGGRLRLVMPTLPYLKVMLGGLALSMLSFGCFRPIARARTLRFIVSHLRVEGHLPFATDVPKDAAIAQSLGN